MAEYISREEVLKKFLERGSGYINDYYYIHYADKAERKRMDIEDIVATVIATIVVIGVLLLGVVAVIMKSIGGIK